uniref:Uncharacterized protein n=1 Tax=Romanomermis culicivorax TaxID=13658 RepID=A0A915JC17_ROMCU
MKIFIVVLVIGRIYACMAESFWHDKDDCQQLCLEMENHRPFTKTVTFTSCMHDGVDKRSSNAMEKLFCIKEIKRGTFYYVSNVASRCGNNNRSKPIAARNEALNKCKRIWAQCADECSTDCYHDAVLDDTPQIGPKMWPKSVSCN